MKIPRLPWSLFVPLLALILCSALLLFPTFILFDRLRHATSNGQNLYLNIGGFQAVVPKSKSFSWSFGMAIFSYSRLVSAINLPGFVASHLIFGRTRMMPDIQGAIVSPILCLPAWWFLGRIFDGLFGVRRLRWPTLISGTIFCIFFLAAALALAFGMSPQEQAELTVPIWSVAFWGAAFAVSPIAWLKQRGVSRRDLPPE